MDAFIKTSSEFDIAKLSFGAMKVLETGGRMIYINYDGNPVLIQTPEMHVPFGMSTFANDGEASPKYSIDLAFKNVATRAIERKFLEVLSSIDKKVLESVFENSSTWLKKKFASIDVIEALYTPIVKTPKDKEGEVSDKYPQTFKMNVPSKDGKFVVNAYDMDGLDIDVQSLIKDAKGARMTAIVQCSGIWIAGGKFGCSWRALQLRVNKPASLPPCAFAYDDDEFDVKVDDSDSGDDIGDIGGDAVSGENDAHGFVDDCDEEIKVEEEEEIKAEEEIKVEGEVDQGDESAKTPTKAKRAPAKKK